MSSFEGKRFGGGQEDRQCTSKANHKTVTSKVWKKDSFERITDVVSWNSTKDILLNLVYLIENFGILMWKDFTTFLLSIKLSIQSGP